MQKLIIAEWYKIKGTPMIWLTIIAGLLTSTIVTTFYLINVTGTVNLDTNPWLSFLNRSFAVNAIFIMLPFVILLTTYTCHLENQSNGWKFLYTLPTKRAKIYFSKLITIVILLLLTLLIYFVTAITMGYLVDLIYPIFEFRFYQPDITSFLEYIFKLFLSLLGVISFQYWISMQSKNFIFPIGLGLLGFFVGFIFFASNSIYGQYFPYAFPMFIKKFNMVKNSGANAANWYQISGVISVFMFTLFTLLGIFQNKKKNIK